MAIKAILEKDDNAVIMFPKDSGQTSEIATKRIKKNIGKKLLPRLIYHPWASNVEFLSYLKEVDVIIDTFHFGAGTTLYYAFEVDALVVTLPGMTSGGRVTNAVYKKMGIKELIAKDKADYVDIAVRCAKDKNFSKEMKERIKASKQVLYNDLSAVPEIKDFLVDRLEKDFN
jgi:predicted O-linked N-acetylglucosamine transferase (SPINDLY family)